MPALPGGDYSRALGINDAGQVVGTSASFSGARAFLWTAAEGMQDLNASMPDGVQLADEVAAVGGYGVRRDVAFFFHVGQEFLDIRVCASRRGGRLCRAGRRHIWTAICLAC